MTIRIATFACLLALMLGVESSFGQRIEQPVPASFERENLVAWCIVPFDAKKRGPAKRVEMLQSLGINRVAYDWRKEHVAEFEQEILAYKDGGIEFFAFWSWHDALEPLIRKHGIRPQIWYWCPSPKVEGQQAKVMAAAEDLMPIVDKARSLGLKVALYNHGGWGGTPENLAAVCDHLRKDHNADHVGIVYNFHHGHEHVTGFDEALKRMKRYLFCVNLNGMLDPNDVDVKIQQNKIRPIGSGLHETGMIQSLIQCGYDGPIGILDHRNDLDTKIALQANLDGLSALVDSIQPSSSE